jgi:hypothetical protein
MHYPKEKEGRKYRISGSYIRTKTLSLDRATDENAVKYEFDSP